MIKKYAANESEQEKQITARENPYGFSRAVSSICGCVPISAGACLQLLPDGVHKCGKEFIISGVLVKADLHARQLLDQFHDMLMRGALRQRFHPLNGSLWIGCYSKASP